MVTIKDIATAAGVSHATVSFVLNGHAKERKIREAVCLRIRKLAKEMGYLRNEVAHSFGTGTSNIIGVILPRMATEFTGRLLYGVSIEAAKHGYLPKLFPLHPSIPKVIKQCVGQRVAGVITYDLSSTELHHQLHDGLAKYGIPLCIAAGSGDPDFGLRISSDQENGCRQALLHIANLGRRDTAVLSDGQGFRTWSLKILEQYKKEAEKLGLPPPFACSNVQELLSRPCQAIFCVSDYVAVNAIMHLRLIGHCIPEEISVIGYGNLKIGIVTIPQLTSLDEQLEQLGMFALRKLLWKIHHPFSKDRAFRFPMQLTIRDSAIPLER